MTHESHFILDVRVDVLSIERASEEIIRLSRLGHHYVCAANVHMVVESTRSKQFENIVNGAAIVTPDGRPLMWALRLLGAEKPEQVTGYALAKAIFEKASERGIPVGFYGSSTEVLDTMVRKVKSDYPELKIVVAISPPFRKTSKEEDKQFIKAINQSGAKIVFVGLGCPKQEIWMATHKAELSPVTIGIGAAFEFLGGTRRRAPVWLQKSGLEWVYRLVQEPKRLWKRYLIYGPIFCVRLFRQYRSHIAHMMGS